MFKSKRKVVRKCRDNRSFTDRGSIGAKKSVGNSNITTKRLTIPPGFLCIGITSGTNQKSENQQNSYTQKDYILPTKKDLHGLLHNTIKQNNLKPRRSSRISKKCEKTQNLHEDPVSHYCSGILRQHSPLKHAVTETHAFNRNDRALKNKSKSLFREINKRCAKIASEESMTDHSDPIINSKAEGFQVSAFCKNLYEEIHLDLEQNKTLLDLKSSIAEKIENINKILSGKLRTPKVFEDIQKANTMEKDPEGIVKKFEYIPKCQWVYETPPRQKIILPKVDACAIQPAVICTNKRQSNVYELNPNVKIDLNKFSNRQNIDVDGRYLRHLASFQDNIQIDAGLDSLETRNRTVTDGAIINIEDDYENKCSNSQFHFGNPFLNVPQHQLMPVISRPTKSVSQVPRMNNIFKRKIEELESTPTFSHVRNNNGHIENDFTFINDEGEFKIVNTQCTLDDSNSNFQFRKNLFQMCGEDNLFNFTKEEQKMFDFSQLKRDDC